MTLIGSLELIPRGGTLIVEWWKETGLERLKILVDLLVIRIVGYYYKVISNYYKPLFSTIQLLSGICRKSILPVRRVSKRKRSTGNSLNYIVKLTKKGNQRYMREPKWKKEFRNRFVDDDGLMHNKYAAEEIIKYFEEIIYDTFWRATVQGHKDAMKTKEKAKKTLKL